MFTFNEGSTHPLTTCGDFVCRLRKEVLLAKAGVCNHKQQQQQQGEQEGGHGQAFQSRQAAAILTHTGGIVMSCLRSLESVSISVHVLCWCAARQVAHSAAERSKCRYLQNLPGWHRHAAVAPPHEASPDMSGRRPCRAFSSRTDRSRDVLPRNSQLSQHWTRLPLAPPSKELTTTWVLWWRTGGTLGWCSPTWLAVSVHSSRHRCSTQLIVSWPP